MKSLLVEILTKNKYHWSSLWIKLHTDGHGSTLVFGVLIYLTAFLVYLSSKLYIFFFCIVLNFLLSWTNCVIFLLGPWRSVLWHEVCPQTLLRARQTACLCAHLQYNGTLWGSCRFVFKGIHGIISNLLLSQSGE